ncbi:MAG: hypothetical protein Q7U51_08090 [Methanoregula sp.]|nr:hypothetical protein [Methanoregula sp.]
MEDCEKRKTIVSNRSPLFGGYLSMINRIGCSVDEEKLSENELELYHEIEKVSQTVRVLTDALKILALGIDYRKYSKFMLIAPDVNHMKYDSWDPKKELKNITESDVDFCFAFVVECSLKLQEFDYDLKQSYYEGTLDKWF